MDAHDPKANFLFSFSGVILPWRSVNLGTVCFFTLFWLCVCWLCFWLWTEKQNTKQQERWTLENIYSPTSFPLGNLGYIKLNNKIFFYAVIRAKNWQTQWSGTVCLGHQISGSHTTGIHTHTYMHTPAHTHYTHCDPHRYSQLKSVIKSCTADQIQKTQLMESGFELLSSFPYIWLRVKTFQTAK